MFRFDFQFFLTGFANPVVFSIDEGVIVDAFAVVVRTEIAFHTNAILSYLRLHFFGGFAEDDQIHSTVGRAPCRRGVRCDGPVLAVADGRQARCRNLRRGDQILQQESSA